MSAELIDSVHHSLLTAKGFEFKATRLSRGKPWRLSIGNAAVGFIEHDEVKTWQGVEICVRGAALKLYGLII
jgi:hypothetical protein